MFALLGVTTLVLIAAVPGGVRSAAGERRGVPAQAPGTGLRGRGARLGGAMLEAAVRGGGWVVLDVLLGGLCSSLAAVLRLKPIWTRISNGRKWCSRANHAACSARGVPVPGLGAPSPRALQPSAAGCSSPPRHVMCESLCVEFVSLGSSAGPLNNNKALDANYATVPETHILNLVNSPTWEGDEGCKHFCAFRIRTV